ncbi:BTAD domain-containing putative transcriptional regulator [Nocardiopsis mangrovi]|uniref:BTAD domain-containing putative transcriptional regulator n=1 Tax=Nocardiopsis mangrovi TaxID=1179818 RepID=A0ABV9DV74_9ACTN
MKFTVLGSFEISHNGQPCTPSAPKVRQVLALLALRARQVVSLDALIEELWNESPPRSAVTTAQTYVYQLRKGFDALAGGGPDDPLLFTRPPGYTLELGGSTLDASEFDRLLDTGQSLLEDGDAHRAADILREALALWSGPVLANVSCGPLLRGYAAHLEERRITALELRISADIRIGRHRELIPELKSLVSAHPLNEWLHAQLIIALNTTGRRGEALRAYQELRSLLNRELGLDPSAELQRIHQDVLTSDRAPGRASELAVSRA